MAIVTTNDNNYKAIADAVRDKTGTDTKYTPGELAGAIDEVYEANTGINPEWTDWRYFSFYDNRNDLVAKLKYTDTSKGTNFSSMFSYCSNLTSIPEIDTSNGTEFGNMFNGCSKLSNAPDIDTSKATNVYSLFNGCKTMLTVGNKLDFSNATSASRVFYNCNWLGSTGDIDVSKVTNLDYLFYNCLSLTKIKSLDMSSATSANYIFTNCNYLQEIEFKGTFNVNNVYISSSSSKGLTKESILSLLNALKDRSAESTQYTITIYSRNLNKLTEEEKAIATDKGWILK